MYMCRTDVFAVSHEVETVAEAEAAEAAEARSATPLSGQNGGGLVSSVFQLVFQALLHGSLLGSAGGSGASGAGGGACCCRGGLMRVAGSVA